MIDNPFSFSRCSGYPHTPTKLHCFYIIHHDVIKRREHNCMGIMSPEESPDMESASPMVVEEVTSKHLEASMDCFTSMGRSASEERMELCGNWLGTSMDRITSSMGGIGSEERMVVDSAISPVEEVTSMGLEVSSGCVIFQSADDPTEPDSQEDERRKERNRQKSKKKYERKHFERQIKQLTGDISFHEKGEVSIWEGGREDGRWIQVTQLTPMCQVRGVGIRGHHARSFRGAIVAIGKRKDREYRAVREEFFKIEKPCHAPFETHDTALEYPATMWTGTCPIGGACGYVFVDFGRWNGELHRRWVPAERVRRLDNSNRNRKPVVRLGFEEEQTKIEKDHSMFGEGNPGNINAAEDDVIAHYKFFKEEDMQERPAYYQELIQRANVKWGQYMRISELRHNAAQIDKPEKERVPFVTRSTPASKYTEMSLVFDIFRGELRGSLSKDRVDDVLGVNHADGNPYLSAVASILKCKEQKERSKMLTIQKNTRKVPCKVDGCKSFVHYQFAKYGVCYKHADDEYKKKCIDCHKNLQMRKGGLCRRCYGRREIKTEVKATSEGMCSICKVRSARASGGRCTSCLA
jgi:hypothetical protein